MIAKVGYNAAKRHLFVEFKGSGRQGPSTWRYDEVQPSDYSRLTAAASIGKEFLGSIRGNFPAHKVS